MSGLMLQSRPQGPFAPWGAPKGRIRGPSCEPAPLPPRQFGRMTYGRAIAVLLAGSDMRATASHGLMSSPRGERGRAKEWWA
jgi:hypothetical protein